MQRPNRFTLILLAANVFIMYLVVSNDLQNAREKFNDYNLQVVSTIVNRALVAETSLQAFSAYLESNTEVDHRQLNNLAASLIETYPFLYMFEIVQKTPHEQREKLERNMQHIYPGFKLREFDYKLKRHWKIAGIQKDYYPVIYQYPFFDDNRNITGFDINSSLFLREAIKYSEKMEKPIASRPFNLIESESGYVIHNYIDQKSAGTSISKSRFALLVLKSAEIFSLPDNMPDNFHLKLRHSLFDNQSQPDSFFLNIDIPATVSYSKHLLPSLSHWRNLTDALPSQPFILETHWQLCPHDFSYLTLAALLVFTLLSPFLLQRYFVKRLEGMKQDGQLYYMANFDALTGLANRNYLFDHMEKLLLRARRQNEVFCLLFIDINGFKNVNDCHGHAAGDFILSEFSERIKPQLRENEILSRYGGDEFILITDTRATSEEPEKLKARLRKHFNEPVLWEGHEYTINIAIGHAIYPHDGINIQALIETADNRMYKDKAEHKKRCQQPRGSD